jgi:ribosomal protein S21
MINVQVTKANNDNNANLIRKFTRKVQEAGILNRVRSLRYSKRDESPYVRKKKTLKSLKRRKEIEHMIKMGKMRSRETTQSGR